MSRTPLVLFTTVLALSGFGIACGVVSSSDFSGDERSAPSAGADAGFGSAASPGADEALGPVDNAVILVHAAKTQSFRLCFENERDRLPQPDSQTMPEANVVGVEVGSAVRLGPLRGAPGEVFLFEEPLIRAFYPTFGGAGKGPTCQALLQNANLGVLAVRLGRVDVDLSRGVHILAVRGCPADGPIQKYSAAECGAGWTPTQANLSVKEIALTGAKRTDDSKLPAQVVNLSQSLESARGTGDLVVSFGDLASGDDSHAPVAKNPPLFGNAEPATPTALSYASGDTAIYDSVGFRVRLQNSGDGGAGVSETVLDESLARIQKASSPRDLPPSYYAAASNYALLLLGNPEAKLEDGGADKDPRRNVHLLAVPVIAPKVAEGDAGADEDGGGAPSEP